MPPLTPPLILVTGIMASGKSSVAQRLAERTTPRSVHLRGDAFRTMIVAGRVEREVPLSDEALRQVELRYRISADVAAHYLAAGFSVVYQDVIIGEALRNVARALSRHQLHVVVLCPRAEVVAARDQTRHKRAYDRVETEHFDTVLRTGTPRIGLWLDTSKWEIEETAERILAELAAARVTSTDLR